MNTKIVKTSKPKSADLWRRADYPLLVESKDGDIGVIDGRDSVSLTVLHSDDIVTGYVLELKDDETWTRAGWTPVIGSRTIEFSN